MTVGRLQRRKGQEQIIRALPEIRKRVPDVLYAIVGDGGDLGAQRLVVDAQPLRRRPDALVTSWNVPFRRFR